MPVTDVQDCLTGQVPDAAARLNSCLCRIQRGPGDRSLRRVGADWFRATRTPQGPALVRLSPRGVDVEVTAWGPGAGWSLDQAPRLLGGDDHPEALTSDHPGLRAAARAHPELRIGATDNLTEAVLRAVTEQKVTAAEAVGTQQAILAGFGEPAPGPARLNTHPAHGMLVWPSAEQLAGLPGWQYTRVGLDAHRTRTLRILCSRMASLTRALAAPDAEAGAILTSLPGVGPWTSARIRQEALGDPDAWSVGDYHVPGILSHALTGTVLDAEACARLMETWRGQRYRVELLVCAVHRGPARRGPRRELPSHVPGVGVRRAGLTRGW